MRAEQNWTKEDTQIFRETVRRFIQEEFALHQDRWRRQQGPDADAWTTAGTRGILLPDFPEAFGGAGGTFAHEATVIEELARAGIHFGSNVHSIVAHYILAFGNDF